MKKIPILLSSLTLATAVAPAVNTAIARANEVAENAAVASETGIAGDALPRLPDVVQPEANIYNRFVRVNVRPSDGQMRLFFEKLTGNWAQKIVVVQHKYETGLTEEEADARMTTLGEDDFSDWATELASWENNLGSSNPYYSSSENIMIAEQDRQVLRSGRPNIFYYAVQFWHKTEDEEGKAVWDGSFWVRGKINLRSCVRSSANNNSELYCVPDSMVEGEKYNFVLKNYSTNQFVTMPSETIKTWAEEWQEIVRNRTQTMNSNISSLRYNVISWANLADKYDKEVADLLPLLEKMKTDYPYGGFGDQIYNVKQAQKQIQEVRDFMQNLSTSDDLSEKDAEIALLQAENEALKEAAEQMKTENNTLKQETEQLRTEKEDLSQDLESARTENTNLKQDLEQKKTEMDRLNQELEAAKAPSDSSGEELAEMKTENERLQQEIKALRAELANLNNSNHDNKTDQEKIAALDSRIKELEQKQRDLEQEKGELERKYQDLLNMNNAVKEENSGVVDVVQDNSSNTTHSKAESVTQNVAQSTIQNTAQDALEVSEGHSEAEEPVESTADQNHSETPGNGLEEQKPEAEQNNEDVEVPNLGAVKTNSWLWYLILPVITILMAVVGVRKFWAKRR